MNRYIKMCAYMVRAISKHECYISFSYRRNIFNRHTHTEDNKYLEILVLILNLLIMFDLNTYIFTPQ